MVTAKYLKKFLESIPDNAKVIFNEGNITCLYEHNALALNK